MRNTGWIFGAVSDAQLKDQKGFMHCKIVASDRRRLFLAKIYFSFFVTKSQ